MAVLTKLNIGIAGACGRGASFKQACDALPNVRIQAVCDINAQDLPAAAERLGAEEYYVHYEDMLNSSELDAVIIGTPMQFHVPQSIPALEKGLHVLCEVPAGVSIEECQRLTQACQRSGRIYMMAENYTYIRSNVIVRSLVDAGLFGKPYFADGEYIHELKQLNEQTTWRRKWQTGIDGVTYGTHSLGPILQWMRGDRAASVCCAGSGHHYRDPRGDEYENQDACVMLCRMRSGGLVKIRVDMLSDRPHSMTNYQLQGTDGAYESARAAGEKNRIWLRGRGTDPNVWMDLNSLADEFLPEYWKQGEEQAAKAGHGGGDYFEILDFVNAIEGTRPCPIGIHEAMDMTLPGLCSQESIRQAGAWINLPEFKRLAGVNVIDAHLHCWDINRFRYAWMCSGASPMRRNFLLDELQPQMQTAGVDGAVLVQADGSVAEAAWMFALAQQFPNIRGVVAWVDLDSPGLFADLEMLAANPLFKGIRPYFENAKDMHALRPALARLDSLGVSIDLLTGPNFLNAHLWMAQDYAHITFIYDHLAEAFRTPGGIHAWKALLKPAAALPNVAMKVSGYLTAAPVKPLKPESLWPYLEAALELFGARRLLFGGDWPICTQAGSYQDTVDVLKTAAAPLSFTEQAELWGGSAVSAYKL